MSPFVIPYVTESLPYNAFAAKWIPQSSRIIVCGSYPRGTGVMTVYEVFEGKLSIVDQVEKKSPFKCLTVGTSTSQLRNFATGDFDGTVSLWSVQQPNHPLFSAQGHTAIVNSIAGCGGGCKEGPLELLSGSRDGTAKVWDIRQQHAVGVFECEEKRDCWAVAFGGAFDGNNCTIALGYDNGDLRVYDLRMNKAVYERNLGAGICSLEFSDPYSKASRLIATTTDSIHVMDCTASSAKNTLSRKYDSTVWCAAEIPQNHALIGAVTGAGTFDLFSCSPKKLTPRATHTLGANPVVSVAFSPDYCGLGVAVGMDQTLSVFVCANANKP